MRFGNLELDETEEVEIQKNFEEEPNVSEVTDPSHDSLSELNHLFASKGLGAIDDAPKDDGKDFREGKRPWMPLVEEEFMASETNIRKFGTQSLFANSPLFKREITFPDFKSMTFIERKETQCNNYYQDEFEWASWPLNTNAYTEQFYLGTPKPSAEHPEVFPLGPRADLSEIAKSRSKGRKKWFKSKEEELRYLQSYDRWGYPFKDELTLPARVVAYASDFEDYTNTVARYLADYTHSIEARRAAWMNYLSYFISVRPVLTMDQIKFFIRKGASFMEYNWGDYLSGAERLFFWSDEKYPRVSKAELREYLGHFESFLLSGNSKESILHNLGRTIDVFLSTNESETKDDRRKINFNTEAPEYKKHLGGIGGPQRLARASEFISELTEEENPEFFFLFVKGLRMSKMPNEDFDCLDKQIYDALPKIWGYLDRISWVAAVFGAGLFPEHVPDFDRILSKRVVSNNYPVPLQNVLRLMSHEAYKVTPNDFPHIHHLVENGVDCQLMFALATFRLFEQNKTGQSLDSLVEPADPRDLSHFIKIHPEKKKFYEKIRREMKEAEQMGIKDYGKDDPKILTPEKLFNQIFDKTASEDPYRDELLRIKKYLNADEIMREIENFDLGPAVNPGVEVFLRTTGIIAYIHSMFSVFAPSTNNLNKFCEFLRGLKTNPELWNFFEMNDPEVSLLWMHLALTHKAIFEAVEDKIDLRVLNDRLLDKKSVQQIIPYLLEVHEQSDDFRILYMHCIRFFNNTFIPEEKMKIVYGFLKIPRAIGHQLFLRINKFILETDLMELKPDTVLKIYESTSPQTICQKAFEKICEHPHVLLQTQKHVDLMFSYHQYYLHRQIDPEEELAEILATDTSEIKTSDFNLLTY